MQVLIRRYRIAHIRNARQRDPNMNRHNLLCNYGIYHRTSKMISGAHVEMNSTATDLIFEHNEIQQTPYITKSAQGINANKQR